MNDQILILNFDSSYSASIASKLRAERISAKVLPGSTSAESIMHEAALGVILSGGMGSDQPEGLDGQLLRAGIPVLALGSTAPAVACLLGGQAGPVHQINDVETLVFSPARITNGLVESERMFGSIRELTPSDDLQPLASLDGMTVGISHRSLEIYALNCQLEPNDPDMMSLIIQFATDVCGCTRWWSTDALIAQAKADIQQAAGDQGRALCVMSGGLDSGVTALLAHRALGDRLTCLFVDTGLLRENDVVEFSSYYKGAGLNLQLIPAQEQVLAALKGKTGQAEKRQALQDVLREVLSQTAAQIGHSLLIESKSSDYLFSGAHKQADRNLIDSHTSTVAPLADFFKEEIREVGEALGLPTDMTTMQPFPWTGLALRIIGECTRERLNLLRWADALFQHEIKESGLKKRLWKYYAMLYEVPYQDQEACLALALRAVSISHTGSDLRTLPARLPYDLLERYTQDVLAHDPQVVKVIYDITPGTNLRESE